MEQQPQYSFNLAAAAIARAAAMNQGNHVMGGGINRSGTPLHDIDNQSDAGSERSVTSPATLNFSAEGAMVFIT